MKRRCGKCGAFISEKNRVGVGRTTGILIECKKCGNILSLDLAFKEVNNE